ncbi:sugar-transfer associated ATP-grasp domain-containing protein [Lacicoccus alkaliphilus]|uniref:Sugar-transfer associated ATP-grasp n=1 Tax=Lacicoccus alkaliphilus DSM 16010 TaxID=1123231 RepID=A0A1M7H7Y0_9BACL|nr:sugar-transfer associated ATP-grasp domain-containing protein [Salinicoccus alkaliphilus]SHM24449.1 Sugar-transfer associated ATP-grasp [Salinicoccus alkaliphilus DSM 16010]
MSKLLTEKKVDLNNKDQFKKLGVNATSRAFKRYKQKGLLEIVDKDHLEEVQAFYKTHLNRTIDPLSHIVFSNFTGKKDIRIVPRNILREVLLPHFNDRGMIDAYADKNSYDILFPEYRQAHTVIKRVRGQYYANQTRHITRKEAEDIVLNDSKEYILKGSDTANGHGISKLDIENDSINRKGIPLTFNQIESEYGNNFLIQRVVEQHSMMKKIHPSSVNTLRMVTLRWNNKIHNLYTFARFGVGNDVKDNAQQGGLIVGVEDDGHFKPFGVSNYEKVYAHPTTDVELSELGRIPNYELFKQTVRDLHEKILHHDYLSWDIVIGVDGKPTFIEVNFFGGTILNQLALERPIFGELTEEIFQHVIASESSPSLRNVEIRSDRPLKKKYERLEQRKKTLTKNYEKLKASHQQLEEEYQDLANEYDKLLAKSRNDTKDFMNMKNEIKVLESELRRIKNSKSWKYTSFFRKK